LSEKEVTVKMKIVSKYKDRIREDSESVIATQGLLGDKLIQVSVGTPEFKPLEDGALLKTRKNGVSLEDFADKGNELMDNVNQLVKDIKDKEGLVHSLIYDQKGKDLVDQLSGIVRTANHVVDTIRSGQGMLHALIYDRADPNLSKNLSNAVDNMKKTTSNLNEMTAKIAKGEGSIGGLINDPTVYYDLKTLMGKANRSRLIQAVIRHTLSQNEKDTLK
jgi:phospholipid/cholesterol/gamma-HCH transport system substrate-binding protein